MIDICEKHGFVKTLPAGCIECDREKQSAKPPDNKKKENQEGRDHGEPGER